MSKQKGGAFTVSGYLALFLLAALVAVGAYTSHLLRHRQMVIQYGCKTTVETALPAGRAKQDDEYVTHAFPEDRHVCTLVDTICSIKI